MYFNRCLHITGGYLPYKPPKCAKIIECAFRLHNLAIKERVPLMEAAPEVEVESYVPCATVANNTPASAAAARDRVVQKF
jgi:hypothetical protein